MMIVDDDDDAYIVVDEDDDAHMIVDECLHDS